MNRLNSLSDLTPMKESLVISLFLIFALLSCEQANIDPQSEPDQEITPEEEENHNYFLKIGNSLGYECSDIEMYDSSTHILYFKTLHPEFDKLKNESFSFFVNGDTIYKGYFWPSFFSSLPSGPYISTYPLFHKTFALCIDNRGSSKPDLRNDPRLIRALKDRNLLHSGLLLTVNSIDCKSTQITFSFSITNKDQSALLILDPEKTGLSIFHYFTNGLIIRNVTTTGPYITVRINPQTPSPWNGWKSEWLTRMATDETKTFIIDYPIDFPLSPGAYNVYFEYPGLHFQVSKEELQQNNGRIWLGSLEGRKDFVIR